MRLAVKVVNDDRVALLQLLKSLGILPEDRVFFLTEPDARKVAEALNISFNGDIEAIASELARNGLEAFTAATPSTSSPETTTVNVPETWTFKDGKLTETDEDVRDYLREEIAKEVYAEWSETHYRGEMLHTPVVVIYSWEIHGTEHKYVEVQYDVVGGGLGT